MNSLILAAVFSAALLNSLAPGPSTFLVLARASTAGLVAGFAVTAGVVSAQMIHLAVAGLILVLALPLSDHALTGLQLGGAALLIYMAWRLLGESRDDPTLSSDQVVRSDYRHGAMVGLANPFNLIFMFGLLPQMLPAADLSSLDAVWITLIVLFASVVPKVVLVLIASSFSKANRLAAPWISRAAGLGFLAYAAVAVAKAVSA